jgi:thymidine kinase
MDSTKTADRICECKCSYKKKAGRLTLVIGCMFASKSTILISEIKKFMRKKKKCIVINNARDTRYGDNVVATHDGVVLKAEKCSSLREVYDKMKDADVIGIDEIHFFPVEDIEIIKEMLKAGKILIICGLNGSFEQTPFEIVSRLIPFASKIVHVTALCSICSEDGAAFTLKKAGGEKPSGKPPESLFDVGNDDKYIAICSECMFNM